MMKVNKFNISPFVREWVENIEPYIPGEMREGFIKLASNENNYGPSPRVVEALQEYIKNVNVYPYMDPELRVETAEYCGVGKDSVVMGNGSDELLDLILKAFRGPVLGFYPSFSGYVLCSQIMGEMYVKSNLKQDFSLSMEGFMKDAENTNLIFLCNPNNPTGSVIDEGDIVEILELGKITVVDEAYYEFCGRTVASLIEDYNNLIVLRTFSKAFALGGLRVGYGLSNPKIIDLLSGVKQPFSVSSISQVAALAALDDIPYMENSVKKIVADRETLYNNLSRRFRTFKSKANFILIDTSPMKSREFFDRLIDEGIIVRDLGKFDGFSGEYVRISIGTRKENMKLIDVVDSMDHKRS